MKLLFSHSYFLFFDKKQWDQRKPYPPLATIQVASSARSKGFDVDLFDVSFVEKADAINAKLDNYKPDVLVLYDDDFNYLTKMCLTNMREAAFQMIQEAKSRGIHVIVSSSDSTDHFEKYLGQGADEILMGEGDETLIEILERLREGKKTNDIDGIACKIDGEVVQTKSRKILTNLDALSLPAWDLIDITPYKKAWEKHGYFSINMATTRGCPFKCNWCAKPIYGTRYNSRSPQHVVAEMKLIKSLFSFDHIWFADDIFGLKPNWVQEFNVELQKEGLKIPYMIQSRADLLLKDDTIDALVSSGLDEVWIGAESGSQKILDAMDKGTSLEQIRLSTELLQRKGVKVAYFLQFGYPGEDKKDIDSTIEMVKNYKPDDIGISVSYPLPGTLFYERVKDQLNEKANWKDSDDLDLMFVGEYSSAYYKVLQRYVHHWFRWKQGLSKILNGNKKVAWRYVALLPYNGLKSLTLNIKLRNHE
ncbi:MAG: radical SAM protein [Fluviicola sp.]|nr:MAG: radical SAM protein [Fluviicola sp.]